MKARAHVVIAVTTIIGALCLWLSPLATAHPVAFATPGSYVCKPATAANRVQPPPLPWTIDGKPPTPQEVSYASQLPDICPSGQVPAPAEHPLAHSQPPLLIPHEDILAKHSHLSLGSGALGGSTPPGSLGEECRTNGYCYWHDGSEYNRNLQGFEYSTQIAQPKVSNFEGAHSIDQLAAGGGTEKNQYTMEVGFTVDHGHQLAPLQPHFFVFANADKYEGKSGKECYNCNWVPLEGAKIYPDEVFEPTKTTIRLGIKYYNNSWWIFAGTQWIAYIPGSFWGGHFTRAENEQIFGEVGDSDEGPTSQMGNGLPGSNAGATLMSSPILFINENTYETTGFGEEIDTESKLYSLGHFNSEHTAWHFGGPGVADPPPIATTEPATSVTASGARLNGTVNPNFGETYFYFEYGPTQEYGKTFPAPPGTDLGGGNTTYSVWAEMTGFSPATTYHYRVRASNPEGTTYGEDQSFTTAAAPPTVTNGTGFLSGTESGGKLKGRITAEVDPRGSDTHYDCEYGTTPSLGSVAPSPAADIGSEGRWIPVVCELKALPGNSTIYFRLAASNTAGTAYGATEHFTTQSRPIIEGTGVNSITNTEATFTGLVNPEGSSTTARFAPSSWGNGHVNVSLPSEPLGSGTTPVPVNTHATGLYEGVTYQYRLTASNAIGEEWSPKATFMTQPLFATQETPNEEEVSSDTITGLSCQSATLCMAVADYTTPIVHHGAYAAKYNGTTWQHQSLPSPQGDTAFWINAVHCSTSKMCMAVGSYKPEATTESPIAEHWNGTSWTLEQLPLPTGAAVGSLDAVACKSTTFCATVGWTEAAGEKRPFSDLWNGTTWSVSAIENPSGATVTTLVGISCVSSKRCLAVGSSNNEVSHGKETRGIAEHWNGTTWEKESIPDEPSEGKAEHYVSASCATSLTCTIVGSVVAKTGATEMQIFTSSSKTWARWHDSVDQSATAVGFASVSCWEAYKCLAAGNYVSPQVGETILTARTEEGDEGYLENGLVASPRENAQAWLYAASCLGPKECWIGGAYEVAPGETKAFIEKN